MVGGEAGMVAAVGTVAAAEAAETEEEAWVGKEVAIETEEAVAVQTRQNE